MYITESNFKKILNKYDNHCLDCGKKFCDITTLYEATGYKFSQEAKTEIKKAIDNNSDPEAVSALVQQKTLESDPAKNALFKKLKEDFGDSFGDVEQELVDRVKDEIDEYQLMEDEIIYLIDDIIESEEYFSDVNRDAVLAELLDYIDADSDYEDSFDEYTEPDEELDTDEFKFLLN